MIALLLANWRLVALGSVLALALGIVAYARHEHAVADRARAEAQAAQHAAQVQSTIASETDKAAVKTSQIQSQAQEDVLAIQAATGADVAVPPDVLLQWSNGLRDTPKASPDHRSR